MNTPIDELIEYIELLECEPFDGWTQEAVNGYLTACTSIKKTAANKKGRERYVIIMAHNDIDTHDSDDYYDEMYGNK